MNHLHAGLKYDYKGNDAFLETGSLDCTKYAASACLLYQLAERRLTEMTPGCLDTKLSVLIHSVSLAVLQQTAREKGGE